MLALRPAKSLAQLLHIISCGMITRKLKLSVAGVSDPSALVKKVITRKLQADNIFYINTCVDIKILSMWLENLVWTQVFVARFSERSSSFFGPSPSIIVQPIL